MSDSTEPDNIDLSTVDLKNLTRKENTALTYMIAHDELVLPEESKVFVSIVNTLDKALTSIGEESTFSDYNSKPDSESESKVPHDPEMDDIPQLVTIPEASEIRPVATIPNSQPIEIKSDIPFKPSFLDNDTFDTTELDDLDDIEIDETIIVPSKQIEIAAKIAEEVKSEAKAFSERKPTKSKEPAKQKSSREKLKAAMDLKKNIRTGQLHKINEEDMPSVMNNPAMASKMQSVSNKQIDKGIDKLVASGKIDGLLGQMDPGVADELKSMKKGKKK